MSKLDVTLMLIATLLLIAACHQATGVQREWVACYEQENVRRYEDGSCVSIEVFHLEGDNS